MLRADSTGGLCRVALVAALIWEVRPFLRQVGARPRRGLGLPTWEFSAGRVKGRLALTGMDPTPVREAARNWLDEARPDILLSLGFSGALTPELAAGALVLGASVWQYDPRRAFLSAAPAPAPPRPLPELLAALEAGGCRAAAGSLVTTPFIIHKQSQGARLLALPHPVLDLESAILAGVAGSEGLPFLGLRAVTDGAGEEVPDFIAQAGGNVGAGAALAWLARNPLRIRTLFRLWRRSRLAAANLARALAALLPLLAAPGQELQEEPGQEGQVDKDPHPPQGGFAD
jgi:adenosylhomocysteine nucleosidase